MRKYTYKVIWRTPGVSIQEQEKDMKQILEDCASIEKREPFFAFFGGLISIEDRQYQVMPKYEEERMKEEEQ